MPRRLSPIEYEGHRAMLALAGVRQLVQASVSVSNGAANSYTVTDPQTRRVICVHPGGATPATGDIRINPAATATATSFPLLPQKYFVVDAEKADQISFYNTTGSAIVVYVMEID